MKNPSIIKIIATLIIIIIVVILIKSGDNRDKNSSVNTTETTMETTTIAQEATTMEQETTTEASAQLIASPPATVSPTVPTTTESLDFVSYLNVSKSVSQLIVVAASGNTATVTMHDKAADGKWSQILSTKGYVGKLGVGEGSESDARTPSGVYTLSFAFGIKDNPGTKLSYTKVDDSYYWVDDVNSSHYNKFVSTINTAVDWASAEHIVEFPGAYSYVIPIDYNLDCVKGAGSAIFLHVSTGSPTAGCVSVPENDMIFILNHIGAGCVILIDTQQNISKY